jgi:hypothetical protein
MAIFGHRNPRATLDSVVCFGLFGAICGLVFSLGKISPGTFPTWARFLMVFAMTGCGAVVAAGMEWLDDDLPDETPDPSIAQGGPEIG